MQKLLPIGISDYKKLVEDGYYYVDKTRLIEEVWDSGEVVLVTRPRRFGKTLNLSMLRYFFEKSSDSREHLFSKTAIWNYESYKSLHGQFPVIFLSFKNIKGSHWKVCYDLFAIIISEEFKRHRYLLSDSALQPEEKLWYQEILEGNASEARLRLSLQFLAGLLSRYYQTKVIVLIDEYDVPIQSSYVHKFYPDAIEFLKGLLTAILKDSEVLEKGILTGILTLAKAGVFTDLNNLDVFNLTHETMADKFGFTKQEVADLLDHYSIKNSQASIEQWYDGYTFGITTEIFNPWSVLKCIKAQGRFDMYWANTGDNILIKKLIAKSSISMKSELELVLRNEPVEQSIKESITFPELDHRSELVWSLLLFTGYLTYRTCDFKDGNKICTLVIPNQEIRYLYIQMLQEIFQESVMGGQAENLLLAVTQGDTDIFEKLLQSFVLNSMSAYDLPSNEPEKSYHLFVLGLLAALHDTYEVKSNRESGLGRYDIMIIPKKNHKPAIIMEFKIVRPGETLETTAQKALDQIREKKYAQELYDKSISSIIEYGIAFEGKQIFVKTAIQTNQSIKE